MGWLAGTQYLERPTIRVEEHSEARATAGTCRRLDRDKVVMILDAAKYRLDLSLIDAVSAAVHRHENLIYGSQLTPSRSLRRLADLVTEGELS